MKAKDVQSSFLLTEDLVNRYGINFEKDSIYIITNICDHIAISYRSIKSIESNGITLTFRCNKVVVNLWLNATITSVLIF